MGSKKRPDSLHILRGRYINLFYCKSITVIDNSTPTTWLSIFGPSFSAVGYGLVLIWG